MHSPAVCACTAVGIEASPVSPAGGASERLERCSREISLQQKHTCPRHITSFCSAIRFLLCARAGYICRSTVYCRLNCVEHSSQPPRQRRQCPKSCFTPWCVEHSRHPTPSQAAVQAIYASNSVQQYHLFLLCLPFSGI